MNRTCTGAQPARRRRKKRFRKLRQFLVNELDCLQQTCMAVKTRFASKNFRKQSVRDMLLGAGCMLLLAMFALSKREDIADQMLSILLPLLLVCAVLVFVLDIIGLQTDHIMSIAFLAEMGVLLQSLLVTYIPSEKRGTVTSAPQILRSLIFSIVAGMVIAICVHHAIHVIRRWWIILAATGLTAVLYLLLIFAGREENGAKLYLSFGPQFLVAEFTKYLSIVALALILSCKEKTALLRTVASLAVMLINTGGLAAASEFGTLAVLWVVYLALCFLSLPVRHLVMVTALLAVCAAVGYSFTRSAWETIHAGDVAQAAFEQAQQTGNEELIQQAQETLNTQSNLDPEEVSFLTNKAAAVYQKLIDRLNDSQNWQVQQAHEALITAGLLGSSTSVFVPVLESDFIYILLVLKMGVLMGLLVMGVYVFFAFSAFLVSRLTSNETEQLLCVAGGVCILAQAAISAGSATGIIPTIGIGMPLFSVGMSSSTISFALIFATALAGRSSEFYTAKAA